MAKLELTKIRIDGGTQPRAELNQATVAEYAEVMTAGGNLPPPTVFHDGTDHWLADGFHRFFAHRKIGALTIEVEVIQGTQRDAVLYAVGANAAHGLRRTKEDRRKAVLTLLQDAEWSAWSDREIARRCSVEHRLVASVRASLAAPSLVQNTSEKSDTGASAGERTYTTKHGTTAKMKTAGISEAAKDRAAPRDKSAETPGQTEALSEAKSLLAEQSSMLDEAQAEIESLSKVVDASDQMAEARRQIKQLQAENRTLRERLAGVMEESAEAKRIAKSLRAKLDKIEKGRA